MTTLYFYELPLSTESRRGRCSLSFACFILFFAKFRRLDCVIQYTRLEMEENIEIFNELLILAWYIIHK